MLDELRRVVSAATPGPLYTGDADRDTGLPCAGAAYTDEVYAHGSADPHAPIATYELAADAARAVAVANALDALLAVADAARACADDLEAEIAARYPDRRWPSMQRRYERDMEPVTRLRAALEALGATQ